MSPTIQVDESGTLHVPAALLPVKTPFTLYSATVQGAELLLTPVSKEEEPFWKRATPKERAEDIIRWAASHQDGPGLPDSAVGRDAIYE